MNKQKIIDYIELLEAKAYQSDDYFKQRNELYILNQKYKEVLDKIKEYIKEETIENREYRDVAYIDALNNILELLEEIE